MKSRRSLATTSFAGAILALTMGAGAAPSISCVACEVSTSYHAAVRAYNRARAWGTIVRWWVDPEYGAASADEMRQGRPRSTRTEDMCQARPAPVQASER